MKPINKKRTTLIVYGGYPISLDLITTLLGEDSSVIVADDYTKDKQDLFKELQKQDAFKYVTLDSIDNLNSIINSIDYIFIMLDQYLEGRSHLSSNEYISILNSIHNTLEYAKSNKTKVAITFPINKYPEKARSNKNYSTNDLLEAIKKKISEITERNKFVRLLYTGEVIGPGMQVGKDTPFKTILWEAVNDSEINLSGEGLNYYYFVYSSDYVYGLVKANFSKDTTNILLSSEEKISELSFAYKVIEHNPQIEDIVFNKDKKPQKISPELPENIKRFPVRFNFEDTLEKTIDYLYDLTNKKRVEKPKSVIEEDTPVYSNEVVEEKLTGFGKFLRSFRKLTKPFRKMGKKFKRSWVMFINNPKRIFIWSLILVLVSVLTYFLIYPLASIGVSSYLYYETVKDYSLEISATNIENLESNNLRKLNTYNGVIQNSYDHLAWLSFIPRVSNIYQESSKAVEALDYFNKGLDAWHTPISYVSEYVSKLEIPATIEASQQASTQEYYEELRNIRDNSSGFEEAEIYFFKSASLIENINTEYYPANIKEKLDSSQKFIKENKDYIRSVSTFLEELPDLAGIDERKTYLILLHNPYELRPHGGWISGYAKVEIQYGQIKIIQFNNIYNLDGELKKEGIREDTPYHMKQFLDINTLTPSMTNWYLDYPEVHIQLDQMMTKLSGESVDGIISMNLFVLEGLLEETGAVSIEAVTEPISKDNLMNQIVNYHNSFTPGTDNKEDILSQLAHNLYNLINNSEGINTADISMILKQELEQNNIVINTKNKAINAELSQLGFNNNYSNSEDSFYIAPVEWNYGGNKANAYLDRDIKVNSTINQSSITGQITLTYQNNSEINQYPEGDYEAVVRVVFPKGTNITSVVGGYEYTIDETGDYSVAYIDLNVPIQESATVNLKFSKTNEGFESYKILKQSGFTNTSYNYSINDVTRGRLFIEDGEMEEDLSIEL